MRLYWELFPIEDLRSMVETAKRFLTKEKIDRQLAGQSSFTTFMNIRDGYNSKKVVTFDTQDRLDDKIDKLMSMMSKMTAQGNNQNKQLNPRYIKEKGENKQEIIMIKAIIRVDTDQIVVIGKCHLGVELIIDRIIEECKSQQQQLKTIPLLAGTLVSLILIISGKESFLTPLALK